MNEDFDKIEYQVYETFCGFPVGDVYYDKDEVIKYYNECLKKIENVPELSLEIKISCFKYCDIDYLKELEV